jgi:type I restriction enzyme, S subunit
MSTASIVVLDDQGIAPKDAAVPPGYKRTDIGIIPKEWDVRTLGELTLLLTNGFVGKATDHYTECDGVLYIQGYNVIENGFNLHGIKHVTAEFHSQHQRSCLRTGDLLTIQTGDIGVTTVVSAELAGANCHALVISRLDLSLSEPAFFCQYFNSEQGRKSLGALETGSTMKHLNTGDMERLLLPSPQTGEQKAISRALSDADRLISALAGLIVKKRAIKLATMQQLLTGRSRLPGFTKRGLEYKATRLGKIPDDWTVCKIREIGSIRTGPFGSSLHERDYVPDGTPIITVEHLSEFGILHSAVPMVSERDRQRLKAYCLQVGDIVFSRVGSVDRNALVRPTETGWLFSGRLLRIRPDQTLANAAFLSYHFHLEEFKTRVRSIAVGQTMASLNTRLISEVDVILPGIVEQKAIAAVLSDMDAEIAALERRRDKIKAIKQGMMQALLTGRIRLVKPGAQE